VIDSKLIDDTVATREARLRKRQRLMSGDAWLSGEGWIGEIPVGGFSDYTKAKSGLEKAFAPIDVLGDVVSAHCDAVAGSESPWSTPLKRALEQDEQPNPQEQALIDEAEALLTRWWDERGAQTALRMALEPLTWANIREPGTRPLTVSPLRLLLPDRDLERDAQNRPIIRSRDPSDASLYIYPDAPTPLQAGAIRDGDGLVIGHFYRYKVVREGVEHVETEICALGKHLYPEPEFRRFAELTFVEVWRGDEVTGRVTYDLGGMLLSHEMTSSQLLVSESVVSEVKQLNAANTLKGINLKEHGFTQEDILNAYLKGHWEDASGNMISEKQAGDTVGAKFIADPVPKGPGILRTFEGMPTRGQNGQEGNATPQIVRHTPSPVTVFEEAMQGSLKKLYLLTRQYHRFISGDAQVSGESRIQATNDFIASLGPTGQQYQNAVQWMLTTVLRLSAYLCGKPGYFDALKVVCKVKYSAVQPTPDMLRVLSEMREKDQLDTETHLELSGLTNDVDASVARMRTEGILEGGALERIRILRELAIDGSIPLSILAAELKKLGIISEDQNEALDAFVQRQSARITPRSVQETFQLGND
jgi:hypothetical protein